MNQVLAVTTQQVCGSALKNIPTFKLKTKAQRINTSAANLDEVIRSIQSSVRVQEQKIESLNSIIGGSL